MKSILLTLRQENVEKRSGYFDTLESSWYGFLKNAGFFPILIPNNLDFASDIVRRSDFCGVILTGGGNIQAVSGIRDSREDIEELLIKHAMHNRIPLLGVCRGVQKIADFFGGEVRKITSHVGVSHTIMYKNKRRQVNSYHDYGIMSVPKSEFFIHATSDDGFIEAIEHKAHPIAGVMWHPERENPFSVEDICLIKDYFGA